MADDAITPVSVPRINELYPGIRPIAYRILQDVKKMTNRVMNVAQSLRSMDDQLAVYSKGRTLQNGLWVVSDKRQIVTNAKPGLSWHCYGLAFDCSWAGLDPYLETMAKTSEHAASALWQSYGGVVQIHGMSWGGVSIHLINGVTDKPHADLTYGLTIAQAMELFDQGGLKSVWAYLDGHRGVPVGQDWGLDA